MDHRTGGPEHPAQEQDSQAGAASPLAGLSMGLPGADSAEREETAVSARQGATRGGEGSGDRTDRIDDAEPRSAQAEIPTAGMSAVDRPSPGSNVARGAAAAAAGTGLAAGNASARDADAGRNPSTADTTEAGSTDSGADRGGADKGDSAPGTGHLDAGVKDAANAAMVPSGRDAGSEQGAIPNSDAPDAEHGEAGRTDPTASRAGRAEDPGMPASGANDEQDGIAGSDAPTVAGAVVGQPVSRAPEEGTTERFLTGPGAEKQTGPGASTDAAAAGPTTPAGQGATGPAAPPHKGDIPPSEDQTVAMRVVNPADAPTTAMPIQRMTDRVVPPAGGRPMTPPPNTPRGPAGPRQAGNQGGPHGHGGEETQPPRGPGAGAKQASAPSPADIQPTRPAEQLADGRRQVAPPNEPGPLAHGTEQAQPGGRPVAQPRRIEAPQAAPAEAAPGRSRKWLFAVSGAAVLVLALIAGVVWMTGGDNSPEGQVKAAIGTYTDALRSGDLDGLRASTCGELHDFYQGITPEQFSGVHQLSAEQGSIPVVDSVDAVRITDDTALAEATVSTSADPSTRTARTFDLQRTEDGWKVCDPTATP